MTDTLTPSPALSSFADLWPGVPTFAPRRSDTFFPAPLIFLFRVPPKYVRSFQNFSFLVLSQVPPPGPTQVYQDVGRLVQLGLVATHLSLATGENEWLFLNSLFLVIRRLVLQWFVGKGVSSAETHPSVCSFFVTLTHHVPASCSPSLGM